MSSERQISVLVEIIYTLSGRGLTKDADLLKDSIRSLGHEVSVKALPPQSLLIRKLSGKWGRAKKRFPSTHAVELTNSLQRMLRRLFRVRTRNADLVIHLENIHRHYINPQRPNWLIPNQEWFRSERSHYLINIEAVLCKTQVAERRFRKLHGKVEFLGFSTPGARRALTAQLHLKQPGTYLHVAGSSLSKGTSAVIGAWERHPEWPTLTIVANSPLVERALPANITLKKNLSAGDMRELWRSAAVAVIPSEVEGYGQVLGEAMLAGAVVVTTNAPPMNELVTTSRGYLVPWSENRPWRLGTRYKVTAESLELCLLKVFSESNETINAKALEAQQWAVDNHQAFEKRLEQLIASVTPQPASITQQTADQPG
jgi:glycosyltransferase involved in cell wall biosynthesis